MRRFFKECMVLIVLAIALTECGSTSKKKEKQKIPIKVYYESLCLSCLEYLTGPLKLAHQIDGFYDMVDIKVYPYGNSQLIKSKDGVKMKCQHGERECFGNQLHMCAIKVLGQKTALDFIICSAERIVTGLFHRDFISGDYNYENAGRYCANQIAPEKWPDIRVCAYSESNSKMLSRYDRITKKADPRWAPFITAWSSHKSGLDWELRKDILKYACHHTMIESRPPACASYFEMNKKKTKNLHSEMPAVTIPGFNEARKNEGTVKYKEKSISAVNFEF